ncbi:SWIM zinc finger family protein [Kitasatospora sp. NPDC002965]|uniref:SWIM zinc finger family protein n=1 Tax=Kitasatospora sp. NPDC002965 TaxID=3154775 RepID=UPI0033BED690
MNIAGPASYHRAYPPATAPDGKTDAVTPIGLAWIDALASDQKTRGRIARARSYARSIRITDLTFGLSRHHPNITNKATIVSCSLSEDDDTSHWSYRSLATRVSVAIPAMPDTAWRELTHIARAVPARWAQLDGAGITERLLAEAQRHDLPLLPTPRDLHVNCDCGSRSGPCKHAVALVLQVARVLDTDPLALLLLRGRAAADFLAGVADPDHHSLTRSFRPGAPVALPEVSADDAYARRHPSTRPPLPSPPATGTAGATVSLTPMPGIDMDALTLLALRTTKRASAMLDGLLAEAGPVHRAAIGRPRSDEAADPVARQTQHRLSAQPTFQG